MKKETIRIYACGGMAANNCLQFVGSKSATGFADIDVCFADTSLSNLRDKVGKLVEEDRVYVLESTDGSGKVRKTNYEELNTHVKPILHKYKPADFNIVVFSASGGTGSTLGPIILKELLSKGATAVAIVVGSEESKITIENTVKTLQTLDAISRRQVGKPLVVSYWHNSAKQSRKENDDAIHQTVIALSMLASKENRELDTADVTNFIQFDNATSVKEGLSLLYIANDEEVAATVEYPISAASLFAKYGTTADKLTPEYSCAGYPAENVLKDNDLHFVISQYDVKNIFNRLSHRLDEFNESSSARIQSTALGGQADDNGMVF